MTSHDLGPQKVAFWKGNPRLFQGKSRFAKYYMIWPDKNYKPPRLHFKTHDPKVFGTDQDKMFTATEMWGLLA